MEQSETKFYVFEAESETLRPATEAELNDDYCDENFIEVQSTADGILHHLEIQQYYGRGGQLRLSITQPLDRALKTFAALLAADAALEDIGDL